MVLVMRCNGKSLTKFFHSLCTIMEPYPVELDSFFIPLFPLVSHWVPQSPILLFNQTVVEVWLWVGHDHHLEVSWFSLARITSWVSQEVIPTTSIKCNFAGHFCGFQRTIDGSSPDMAGWWCVCHCLKCRAIIVRHYHSDHRSEWTPEWCRHEHPYLLMSHFTQPSYDIRILTIVIHHWGACFRFIHTHTLTTTAKVTPAHTERYIRTLQCVCGLCYRLVRAYWSVSVVESCVDAVNVATTAPSVARSSCDIS